jgi:hypothetical protein
MGKEKKEKNKAIGGPTVFAPISTRQYAIMLEIKNRTGLSLANQLRAKVRDIETNFIETNPGFKI